MASHSGKGELGQVSVDGLAADAGLLGRVGDGDPGGEGHGEVGFFLGWDILGHLRMCESELWSTPAGGSAMRGSGLNGPTGSIVYICT